MHPHPSITTVLVNDRVATLRREAEESRYRPPRRKPKEQHWRPVFAVGPVRLEVRT